MTTSITPNTVRVYAQTNWSLHECIILQDAKRRDHDRQANGGASKRRGVCRWTLIEDMVWDEGVYRSAQQCKVKWEKLTGEFRKVLDYEKNIPPGRDSYWHITSVDRKDAKLPPNFHKSLYDALMQWYGRSRAVNPGNLILDSGIPETSTPGLFLKLTSIWLRLYLNTCCCSNNCEIEKVMNMELRREDMSVPLTHPT